MQFMINGASREVDIDARTTVLDLLREHLGLTGSKKGCDHGQCSAGTLLISGGRVNSCLALAVNAPAGRDHYH
jgi:xanthine dehydrogenase YagT iron-sulfur-binding subunit